MIYFILQKKTAGKPAAIYVSGLRLCQDQPEKKGTQILSSFSRCLTESNRFIVVLQTIPFPLG